MKTTLIKLIFSVTLYIFISFSILIAQVSEEWTHRYTGPKASADDPTDVAVDNSGNIYMTGQSLVGGDFYKFITVKFNSDGVRQWAVKYNGPDFSNSIGYSVQVDPYGNVYASGYTRIGSGQIDLLLIKYDANGIQQWTQQYNGPGNFDDFGVCLDLDSAGNVYVGGHSFGSGTSYDYVILKYNPSGVNQWTRRWNGLTNNADYLKKIDVSPSGDVVATGYSYKNTSSNDFTTVKYNSAGDLLWMKQYNGPVNGDDQATNLKVDLSGNVYVCGQSRGSNPGNDYAVVKYNSAGTEQWSQRYDSPSANEDAAKSVDTDLSGNVFVTGHIYQTSTLYDFATIKYNSAGVQQWIRFYNGDNLSDRAVDVKSDASGNIYVTGSSVKAGNGSSDVTVIKYDNSGNLIWIKSYDGPGNLDDNPIKIALDASQEPVIIANSYSYFFSILCGSSDYLALRYTTNGNLDVETRYDGSGTGDDEAAAICYDISGNSYVTGSSFDDNLDLDYATLKYNSSGAPLWAVRYDGGYGIDKPVAVATDAAGNVYVTGTSKGSSGNNDIATVKYNPDGIFLWESRYNGPGNGEDIAAGLFVDASGNSIVSGYSEGSGTGKDYVTIKYNTSGAQQWAPRFNGPGNSEDIARALTVDASGNSFVTGKAVGTGFQQDIYTVKYNSSGSQQWVAVFNGAANDSDEATCITLDQNGNIIVGGKSRSAGSNFDLITVKYNSSGSQQWFQTFSGTALNSRDELVSIAADNSNNIFAAGNIENLNSGYDFITIKYNSSGNQLWNALRSGTSGSGDKVSSLCLDASGNPYVSGTVNDLVTGLNFNTVKYSRDGAFSWEKKYNYIDNDTDKAAMVKVDAAGNVFITGSSKSNDSKKDFFTIKYKQSKSVFAKILTEGRYNESQDKMLADTVKILLRNTSSPYNIVDSSLSVTDSSGNCNFFFPNLGTGSGYYIVVDHRNSLETWSASGVNFTAGSLYYDFTSSASQAYGNNLKQKGSRFCVFSGDVNKDAIIDLTDLVFIYNKAAKFTSGYTIGDLNGDEIVDLTDLIMTYNNSANFVTLIRP